MEDISHDWTQQANSKHAEAAREERWALALKFGQFSQSLVLRTPRTLT